MKNFYLDIHALHTVPPSNINRDDTGSPKTAVYGGVRRARVSSQAWKRAIRRDFSEYLDPSRLGTRTKRLVEIVTKHIKEISPDLSDRAAELAIRAVQAGGFKVEVPKAKGGAETVKSAQTEYLLFISNVQARRLAEVALDAAKNGTDVDKKLVKEVLKSEQSVDVALFGRMIANSTDLNVDASVQVAHAISVHAVESEFDYFTAVDDESAADEPGAGMIGTVEFNSSTLYRYATLNLGGLMKNLGDTEATVEAAVSFVRSFVESMPTGKLNTFANKTLPDGVVVSLRERRPVNLVGAFEEAVVAEPGKGRLRVAAERLAQYSAELDAGFGGAADSTLVVAPTNSVKALSQLGREVSFPELVEELGNELPAYVRGD
ncbi:type I-E CRISPR-associated protein Cas7/Cse4/CasC [Arthrobacter sp. RAF14]|uniref:type I-E CRISPR-associated protein Cas7/Cse4/CasC n=1 Tax=Arthrobacter sp. RAF14 TaxID=3233051 RepID=UPI003F916DA2